MDIQAVVSRIKASADIIHTNKLLCLIIERDKHIITLRWLSLSVTAIFTMQLSFSGTAFMYSPLFERSDTELISYGYSPSALL